MIDELGDRMKSFEVVETSRRLDPTLPVYARIDGHGFSKFTRGLQRPFDPRMSAAMTATVCSLVSSTHARIGYTQSDEISLVWQSSNEAGGIFFEGKILKMVSVLAGKATAAFTKALRLSGDPAFAAYQDREPHFDCRVFQLPTQTEAANAFVWRVKDARRNAISMVAQHHFSHRELQFKSTKEMLVMLAEKGVIFDDMPDYFKNGTFVQRVTETRGLTADEIARIPVAKRPEPGHTFQRSAVKALDLPYFGSIKNREAVIFEAATPDVYENSIIM